MREKASIIRSLQSKENPPNALQRIAELVDIKHTHSTVLALLNIVVAIMLQTGCNSFDKGLTQKTIITPLELVFYAGRSQVAVGEVVRMRFTVTNTSKQPWVSESKDTPVLDIIVQDVNSGEKQLSWSSQNPDKVLHRVEWQPGETKVLELEWTPGDGFHYGRLVHLGGILSENSRIVQSASVMICAGPACH